MRIAFAVAAALSFAGLAFGAPPGESDQNRPASAPGFTGGVGPHAPAIGMPPAGVRNGSTPRGHAPGGMRPGRPVPHGPGERGAWRHHYGVGGGMIFFPYPGYPVTWPYPPYSYPYPYGYPYPDDSDDDAPRGPRVPADLPMASAPAYWYYCDAPDGYYPYVKSCSHTWNPIPVAPPPPGAAAPVSYSDWQWCEETKSFFPYVSSCHAGFVKVPVTAPSAEDAGPPAVASWFFCDEPKGYLPYVVQCKHDWRALPAVPPPSVKITVKSDGGGADTPTKGKADKSK